MNKQQFIATSLPYGLKIQYFDAEREINEICVLESMTMDEAVLCSPDYEYYVKNSDCDLIIHPLSDLTKEIEHNGEKFVPSIRLNTDFSDLIKYPDNIKFLQLNIALQLIEWHFDISGLIESGEAIDVNAMEINPYK